MFDEFAASRRARERREAEESDRRLYAQLKERFEPKDKVAEATKLLETIVCTEGEDAGVILLSSDSPCHPEPDPRDPSKTMQVYDHYNFSPLGDALVSLHKKLKEE